MMRIYDEGSILESLIKILLTKTDLSMIQLNKNGLTNATAKTTTTTSFINNSIQIENEFNNKTVDELEKNKNKWNKGGKILTKKEFLDKFIYLKKEKRFDW